MSKKIITYNGEEALSSDCRKIAGQYYTIGRIDKKNSGQCYLFEDTYYRETSPKLKWDYELQKYNHVDNMVRGYTVDGIQHFTRNVTENYLCAVNGSVGYVQNKEAIKKNKLQYDYQRGYFNTADNIGYSKPVSLPRKANYSTLASEIYSLSEYDTTNIKREFAKYKYTPNIFDEYLHNYKFGLEIETDAGWFPENLYYKFGCVPLKDGSILGTEITTLVYPGSVNLIGDLMTECAEYTESNQNNSLHVNLSGFKNDALFRVAMYVLYYRLQPEILAFTPLYKRDLQYFQEKRGGPKDHCKPMESLGIVKRYSKATLSNDIKESDKLIFKFLNEGVYNSDYNIETRQHVRQGNAKWDHQNRYYALNMMPLYFGKTENSRLEFRLHSGTVNKYKTIVWMFICAAITKFVENNAERILVGRDKILLEDVLYETIIKEDNEKERFLLEYITQYIQMRNIKNTQFIMDHKGSVYGDEFVKDRSFTFEIGKLSVFDYEFKTAVKEIGKSSKKGTQL